MATLLGSSGHLALCEEVVASVSLDLSLTAKTTIYTVPAGFTFIPTKIVLRNASASLATADFAFGFDTNASDLVAHTTYTGLTGNTLAQTVVITTAGKIGAAAAVLGYKTTVQQTATVTADVFGYLI